MRQVSEVGNVVVDAASFAPAGLSAAETTRLPMSNALLVGARRSTTGKPLFVAGPQVGHFYPGILLELDLEGGGFKTRGAAFPGDLVRRPPRARHRLRVERDVRRARISSTSTSRRSAATATRPTSTAASAGR